MTCHLTNSNDPVSYSNWRKEFAELINGSDLSGLFTDFRPNITVGEMRGRVLLLSRYEYDGTMVGGICQNFRTPGTIITSQAFPHAVSQWHQ